jgi:hypothetical protein
MKQGFLACCAVFRTRLRALVAGLIGSIAPGFFIELDQSFASCFPIGHDAFPHLSSSMIQGPYGGNA